MEGLPTKGQLVQDPNFVGMHLVSHLHRPTIGEEVSDRIRKSVQFRLDLEDLECLVHDFRTNDIPFTDP